MAAYLIALAAINDPDGYQIYSIDVPDVVHPYHGRFLARGERTVSLDGEGFNDERPFQHVPGHRLSRMTTA